MAIHILGIRHHGPGSAKNVLAYLQKLQPDIVLVEGPPDAENILQWESHKEIKLPVAILCYQPDHPQQSVFYPFAEFSPEWQAIQYAHQQHIHIRFMDLPMAHQFALETPTQHDENNKEEKESDGKPIDESIAFTETTNTISEHSIEESEWQHSLLLPQTAARVNPLAHLANAAGYQDEEQWWEHFIEHRQNNQLVFEAIAEGITAIRENESPQNNQLELLREAYMRKVIRQAEKEMFQNIVVVCGAWHTPALINMPSQKHDTELLKNLAKAKVECTWVPWTYQRLSLTSGYGAGITSPGWYHHIWQHPSDNGTRWMAKVAQLFRNKQMDTSVANVIEAVRLAESLASLRNISKVGLQEVNEATLSILCGGEPFMMSLVENELIISNRIGQVPINIPKPPLQLDIEKQQKKLRLPATADWKDYILDLRKENDLERSIFLHRLLALQINWGVQSAVTSKGTFKEQWRLQWDPNFSIEVIEKGSWGNSTKEAAEKFVIHEAAQAKSLTAVTELLQKTLPAELPLAINSLINSINNLAAASNDVIQLIQAVVPLVNIARYGNVRKTDADIVEHIVQSMITRICIGLPAACTGIDDDAAANLLQLFGTLNDAINTLQTVTITNQWHQTLQIISQNKNTVAPIAGYW
jgi:hypothetical protein